MRIRAGFVSNSSSTSFLIITRDELTEAAFFELMGVAQDSPIADLFQNLFDQIVGTSRRVNLAHVDASVSPASWFDTNRLTPAMSERLRAAAGQGLWAYFGRLSSDNMPIESFFCTDSFEAENERIYFDGLECAW